MLDTMVHTGRMTSMNHSDSPFRLTPRMSRVECQMPAGKYVYWRDGKKWVEQWISETGHRDAIARASRSDIEWSVANSVAFSVQY